MNSASVVETQVATNLFEVFSTSVLGKADRLLTNATYCLINYDLLKLYMSFHFIQCVEALSQLRHLNNLLGNPMYIINLGYGLSVSSR